MGFRTTVILYNDQSDEWRNDLDLGKKISCAMNFAGPGNPRAHIGYGKVVECVHADEQTLAILDSYDFTPIASARWHISEANMNDTELRIKLLQRAAEALGYQLTKR